MVIRRFNEFALSLDRVLAILSDSARYMIKAYNTILGSLMPNSVHVLCLAHGLDLVLEQWPAQLELLNQLFL